MEDTIQYQKNTSISDDLTELELAFLDECASDFDREHAFLGYWITRIETEGGLTHSSLEYVLRFGHWIHSIGDIVLRLCWRDSLSQEDASWLQNVLAASTFAHAQVSACLVVKDNDLDWRIKLQQLLELRTDWAVSRLMSIMPREDLDDACRLISSSKRPRRARQVLLDEIKKLKAG